MKLYDPEMIQVGFRCDLLNVLGLGILDIDHILSSVLKPADKYEVTKGPGVRWLLCRRAFFNRLWRLHDRRNDRPWIRLWSDLSTGILGDYSLLPRYLGRTVGARDVSRIGTRIDGPGIACIDDNNNRVTARRIWRLLMAHTGPKCPRIGNRYPARYPNMSNRKGSRKSSNTEAR